MTDSTISTSKRLLRILVGGSILAAAWVAFDALTHSESASASEIVDVPSIGSDVVSDVVIPLVAPVVSIAAPVEAVVTPVLEPVVEPVLEPVVEAVVAPVVTEVVAALPVLPQLPVPPGVGLRLPDSDLTSGEALAAPPTPLLPLPVEGAPHDLPAVPTTTDTSAAAAAVLSALSLAPPGSALSVHPGTAASPSSPAFGFDTSPD